MSDETAGSARKATELQFDKAEFASGGSAASAAAPCAACTQPLTDVYFEINGKMVCPSCKDRLVASQNRGSKFSRFVRASIFGAFAAIAGSLIYYGIREATGYELGLVSIIVGVLVGIAVRKGCYARGGWLYQLLAVLLTYASITATYAPYVLREVIEGVKKHDTTSAVASAPGANKAALDIGTSTGLVAKADETTSVQVAAAARRQGDDGGAESLTPKQKVLAVTVFFGLIAVVSLIAPLLMMKSSPIMILIVLFGLYEAWRINKRQVLAFTGPYQIKKPEPAVSAN